MVIGNLADGWERKRLGDITRVLRGASPRPKGDPKYYGGTIPWIKISDITSEEGKYLTKTVDTVTPEGVKKSRFLSRGSLILSICATVCVPKILSVDGCIHDGFVYFPDLPKDVDKNFLYYYFQSIRTAVIQENRQGLTQVNLNTGIVSNFQIPLPPLPEQERIINRIEEILSDLDAGVTVLERVRVGLKRYKASVLKAAVEGKLLGSRKIEHGELPEGWRLAKVEELAKVGTGATPLRSEPKYWNGGSIPWITSGALNELAVYEAKEFITELAVKETNAKVFSAGALLVAMYGEGKTRGKVSELMMDAATNQACAALVFTGEMVEHKPYVKLFFEKNYEDIRLLSSGGVQPNLNLSIIKNTRIPLPPLDEQRRIVAEVERRLSVVGEVESAVEVSLVRAGRLRQSVLRSAFEGRL